MSIVGRKPFINDRVLDWLAIWGYSNVLIMTRMLYTNKKNFSLYKVISSLLVDGLIEKKNYQFSHGYELTKEGYCYVSLKNLGTPYPKLKKSAVKNSSTLYHELVTQLIVAYNLKKDYKRHKIVDRCYSPFMETFDEMIKPDATIIENNNYCFIETELSEKAPNRVYYKLNNQYMNLYDNENYSYHYYFTNEYVYNKYIRFYNEKNWPLIKKINGRYVVVDRLSPNNELKSKIKFKLVKDINNFNMSDLGSL